MLNNARIPTLAIHIILTSFNPNQDKIIAIGRIIFASIMLISAIQFTVIAIIGDLLAINRKLLEDVQTRIRTIELNNTKI